jgi:hypothetical protein
MRLPFTKSAGALLAVAALALAGAVSPAAAAPGSQVPATVIVDPSTLTPEPPPGAVCRQAGPQVICETSFEVHLVNEPAFELPCGVFYETVDDVRRGIRWYTDGLLTQRFVFQQAVGQWSLSPTGEGRVADVTAHVTWRNVDVDPFAPEDTWPQTTIGMGLKVQADDGGIVFQESGIGYPNGGFHGNQRFGQFGSPEALASICTALT